MITRYELRCPACGHAVFCGPEAMATRLRREGKLRRAAKPEFELLAELFCSAAAGWCCERCGETGLKAAPAAASDADWPGSRRCESCGAAIPPERVQLLPHVRVCVACQQRTEAGQDTATPDYCPRCGSIMRLRQTRSGVTRYELTCPECKR